MAASFILILSDNRLKFKAYAAALKFLFLEVTMKCSKVACGLVKLYLAGGKPIPSFN